MSISIHMFRQGHHYICAYIKFKFTYCLIVHTTLKYRHVHLEWTSYTISTVNCMQATMASISVYKTTQLYLKRSTSSFRTF